MKKEPGSTVLVFSDKKNWTVDMARNNPSVDALNDFVEWKWAALPEGLIINLCGALRPRLKAMAECEGGHLEKYKG